MDSATQPSSSRYELVDILRGAALFGILAANIRGFNAPEAMYFSTNRYFTQPWDIAAQQLVAALFVGKFISIFAFLFGFGFAAQMSSPRNIQRGAELWLTRNFYVGAFLAVLISMGVPIFARLATSEDGSVAIWQKALAVLCGCFAFFCFLRAGFGNLVGDQRAVSGYFLKRIVLLYCLGWAHVALFWWGDVLTQYAFAGLMLLALRRFSDAVLLRIAWVFALLPAAGTLIQVIVGFANSEGGSGQGASQESSSPAGPAPIAPAIAETIRLFQTGSPIALMRERLETVWGLIDFITLAVTTTTICCFMLGQWVWRKGLIEKLPEVLPVLRRWWPWLAGFGLVYWGFGYIAPAIVKPDPTRVTFLGAAQMVADAMFPFQALFYLVSFVLALQIPAVFRFFRPCGAIGRLSLSNYLLQSMIGMLLFTSTGLSFFGFGIVLYGKVGPAWNWPIMIVIYLLQIPLSQWWERRFGMGPVEKLWKSLI